MAITGLILGKNDGFFGHNKRGQAAAIDLIESVSDESPYISISICLSRQIPSRQQELSSQLFPYPDAQN